MSELKPCPFCGGEAKLYSIGTGSPHYGNYHQVVCQGCLTSSGAYWSGEQSAIDAWNTRHEEIVRCRDCRYYEYEVFTFGEREEYHWCNRDWNGEPVLSAVEPDGFCAWGGRKVEG